MNPENQMPAGRQISPVTLDAHKKLTVSASVTKDERDSLDFLADLMDTDRSKIVAEFVRLGIKRSKSTIVDLVMPVEKRRADFLVALQGLPPAAFKDPDFVSKERVVTGVKAIDVAWHAVGASSMVIIGQVIVVVGTEDVPAVASARFNFTARLAAGWVLSVKLDHLLDDQCAEGTHAEADRSVLDSALADELGA